MMRTLNRSCHNQRTYYEILMLLMTLCFTTGRAVAMESMLVSHSPYDYFNLNSYVSYYIDESKSDGLDAALTHEKWTRNPQGGVLNFGFVDFAVWLKLPLDFDEYAANSSWYLAIPYPLLEKVEVYLLEPDTNKIVWWTTLSNARQNATAFRSHNVDFPLPLDLKGQLTLMLRVESTTSLQVPLELWSVQYLVSRQNMEALIWGVIMGTLLAFLLYNAFLYVSMGDVTYGLYVFNLICRIGLILTLSGLGARYIWFDHGLTHLITPVAAAAALLCLLCFALRFLAGKSLKPVLANAMRAMVLVNIVFGIYVFFVPDNGPFIVSCMGSISLLLVLVSGISCQVAGMGVARYFVFATAALVMGAAVYFANVFGYLQPSQLTNLALPVGSMLEAYLFSLALTHRLKEERRQKLAAMEKMKLAQQTIVQVQEHALNQALHDPITRFPNDAFLLNRLGELIDHRSGCDSFALAMVNFPDFRDISTFLGRRLAEGLFCQVSGRLNHELTSDIQSIVMERSERFFIAVPEFGSVAILAKLGEDFRPIHDFAHHLLELNENAFEIEGTATRLSARCGIAIYPKHGERADLLIQYASAARDYSFLGSDPITIYSSEIDGCARRRLGMVGELSNAIRLRELEAYLQPQFNCRDNHLVGVEVLLRWNSDKFGVVSPSEFIEVAEEAGLIGELTRYVIDESFRLLRSFNDSGHLLTMSINLSLLNLLDAKLISYVTSMAEVHRINLNDVVFEVTETSSSEDFETVIENLGQLSSIGCSISLDDYGTGYSSLAYLSRLPVQELKIDRSFISQMTRNDSDYRIVENTVKLSRALQIQTVAEGIEDQETLNALNRLGCDRAQGYFLAHPMPVAQFRDWLLRRVARACI